MMLDESVASIIGDQTLKHGWGWPVPARIVKSTFVILLLGFMILYLCVRAFWPPKNSAIQQVTARQGEADVTQRAVLPAKFTNRLGMEFVLVPHGTFLMGGGNGTVGGQEVEIAHDFYLGVYEVTQEQWQTIMGLNPSYFARQGSGKDAVKDIPDAELKRFPVENVSWNDAQRFLDRLNTRDSEPGWAYRLPKEIEWEYACRGGPASSPLEYGFDFYFEKPSNVLRPEQANFDYTNGLKRPCKVGTYKPNRLGLYDMHGNVWEWCADPYGGLSRVRRGGGWSRHAATCRAAYRSGYEPGYRDSRLGLRLARVIVRGRHDDVRAPKVMLINPDLKPSMNYCPVLGQKKATSVLPSPS